MQRRFDASSATKVPNEDDEYGTIAAEDPVSMQELRRVIVVPRSLGGDGIETGDSRSRSSKNLVPSRPREHGDDGGE